MCQSRCVNVNNSVGMLLHRSFGVHWIEWPRLLHALLCVQYYEKIKINLKLKLNIIQIYKIHDIYALYETQ